MTHSRVSLSGLGGADRPIAPSCRRQGQQHQPVTSQSDTPEQVRRGSYWGKQFQAAGLAMTLPPCEGLVISLPSLHTVDNPPL